MRPVDMPLSEEWEDDPPEPELQLAPFILYHWAPQSRRRSIQRLGLVPGKLSTCGAWRPPYVCLAHDPAWSWCISGGRKGYDVHGPYDLWQVYSDGRMAEALLHPAVAGYVQEWRVYDRIYKRDVHLLGTR